MALVLLESLLGLVCPLTTWEDALRMRAGEDPNYQGTFIAHWIGLILFYDLGEQVFAIIYAAVFASFLFTFWVVPPRRPR